MTQNEIQLWLEEFWTAGGFLRLPDHRVQIWKGPWVKLQRSAKDQVDFTETLKASISHLDFFESQASFFISEDNIELSVSELCSALESKLAELGLETSVTQKGFSVPKKDDFEKSLQVIQGKIHRSEIEKAVPVVISRNESKPSLNDRIRWIKNALAAPSNSYPYGFWSGTEGIIGVTPEILFQLDQGRIKSMALAGTCPRSEISNRPNLLKDPKELLEHDLVVKDLETQLGKIGLVRTSPTRILELPTLLHLVTDLSVEARGKTSIELMKLLHPTPALGVSPRAYGYYWMRELAHQKERQMLGVPICFRLGEFESLCLVAIRAVQWGNYGTQVGAGCGIVATSELDREWNEVLQKIQSIYLQLGI